MASRDIATLSDSLSPLPSQRHPLILAATAAAANDHVPFPKLGEEALELLAFLRDHLVGRTGVHTNSARPTDSELNLLETEICKDGLLADYFFH